MLAHLLQDREAAFNFCLTCKSNTKFVRDITFWRVAVSSQGRQIPDDSLEDANSRLTLASLFHKRIYAENFLMLVPGRGAYSHNCRKARRVSSSYSFLIMQAYSDNINPCCYNLDCEIGLLWKPDCNGGFIHPACTHVAAVRSLANLSPLAIFGVWDEIGHACITLYI